MKKIVLLNSSDALARRVAEIAPDRAVVQAALSTPFADISGEDVEIVAGFGRVVGKIIEQSPNLRWVQTWSAGVDAVPLAPLRERGAFLTNASGVHAKPISESIFAMLLALRRGVVGAVKAMRERNWEQQSLAVMYGLPEIHGQTLAVLGAGKIGAETAKIAKAFNMRTIAFVRNPEQPREYFDVVTDNLLRAVSDADCVVNILPLTAKTRRLIGEDVFAAMKPSACYISVGRGPTTDYAALCRALEAGTIACAGVDVTDPEPLPGDDPFWNAPNLLIMPHISGATPHYDDRAAEIFIENLSAYVSTGEPVRNVVDLTEGY